MKVFIKTDWCIGCGRCVSLYPEIFELTADKSATCKIERVAEGESHKINSAKMECPVSAIIIED